MILIAVGRLHNYPFHLKVFSVLDGNIDVMSTCKLVQLGLTQVREHDSWCVTQIRLRSEENIPFLSHNSFLISYPKLVQVAKLPESWICQEIISESMTKIGIFPKVCLSLYLGFFCLFLIFPRKLSLLSDFSLKAIFHFFMH